MTPQDLAALRLQATLAGFDPTGQFANRLAVDHDDRPAQAMLAGVRRAVDAIRTALARGDGARAHRLLDRLDTRLVELAGYCLERQAELYPAAAVELERDDAQRLDDLARSDARVAGVVRERRHAIAAARAPFARRLERPAQGRDLVRTLLGQVRARAPRAHSPPTRAAPASNGSPARPSDDDPDDLAATAGAPA